MRFESRLLLVLMEGWSIGALYAGPVSRTLPLIRAGLGPTPRRRIEG